MRLTSEHHLPASPDAVARLLADPAFIEHKAANPQTRIDDVVVTGSPDADFTVTIRRSVAAQQIPPQARPFVGERLEVRQVEAWSTPSGDTRHGTIAVEITGAPVRLTGSVALRPGADGGCDLLYAGEIKASVPLFGPAIEQAAAGAIRTVLDQEAVAAREWLATHPAP